MPFVQNRFVTRLKFFVCLLLLSQASLIPAILHAQQSGTTVVLRPGQDVAAAVHNAPPGTAFTFSPGLYRQQSIVPKNDDRFLGQDGAVLDGAVLLSMRPDGPLWSAMEPITKSDPKECLPDHPRCYILNDLFLDDHLQTPVADLQGLRPGSWYYDLDTQKVYIGVNPAGHTVELGMTALAFSGNATGVLIDHLLVEKYASPPQRGAIGNGGVRFVPAGWTVLDSEVRWNHGAGIHLGSNGRIESCFVHDNGQLGLGASGPNVLVTKNEISFNNYAGYSPGWEAGATKFANTDNLVLRSNYVHDNNGAGLWTDIDNIHVLMEKNTVLNNADDGIRHEISFDAIIRNNLIRGNGAGIVVAQSSNVDVYGNVIEVPVNGDFAFRLDTGHRQSDAGVPYTLRNVRIHENVISYLGAKGHSGLVGQTTGTDGLVFDQNEYHVLNGQQTGRWRWNNQSQDISSMRQFGMEVHGTILKSPAQLQDPTRKDPLP